MVVSVCICTFRRPALLSLLLKTIGEQRLGNAHMTIELIVVDNDPDHSARMILASWQAPAGFSLRYFHAPVPNIAVARNMAVQNASGEWLAFIDDDETPEADWLCCLIASQVRFNADAVFGPIVPRYLPRTPDWLREGGYFERRRMSTGTVIDERDARTGNVLLRKACLQTLNGPFDVTFGRTGGEDSLLFRDLQALGCSFVWCDEAPVSEEVPIDRANSAWLLRRSFRIGQTWIRAELYRLPRRAQLVRGLMLGGRAVVQLVLGILFALGWAPLSRTRSFNWLRIAVAQAGKLTGMTRFRYHEYGA